VKIALVYEAGIKKAEAARIAADVGAEVKSTKPKYCGPNSKGL